MKFSCLQENLSQGISSVGHIALKATTLPILSNILLKTEHGSLTLAATNLEAAIKHLVRGKVEKSGECLVPAKLLLDLLPLLSGGPIDIEKNTKGVVINTNNTTTTLRTNPTTEFPIIPTIEKGEVEIKVDGEVLRQILQQTALAAGRVEQRPQFSGVLVRTQDKILIIAATDGYRLAESSIHLPKIGKSMQVIVPSGTIQEVIRNLSFLNKEDGVRVVVEDNQVKVVIDGTEITSRIIDGEYPDYQPLFPPTSTTECLVNRGSLIKVVKASTLFSKAGMSDVTLEMVSSKKDIVKVFSENGEVGSYETSIKARVTGENIKVVLNARYVLDGLNAMVGEEVQLKFAGADRPVLLLPAEQVSAGYRYLIMPIKR